METYAINCTCGHTMTFQAEDKEGALRQGLDGWQSHLDEFHADDPQKPELEAMSYEEREIMMRPLIHVATAEEVTAEEIREPAFGEKIEDDRA